MNIWYIGPMGLLTACVGSVQTDEGPVYHPNCSEVVLEELGVDEVSTVLGVSASDVVGAMTAVALGSGELQFQPGELPVDLTVTVEPVTSIVQVVDVSGDDACFQGRYLRADVVLRTLGTIGGWEVDADNSATIYASGADFSSVWLGEHEGVLEFEAVVPLELAEVFYDPNNILFSGDPAAWTWILGPGAGSQRSWLDSTIHSSLVVNASSAELVGLGSVLDFEAVDAAL